MYISTEKCNNHVYFNGKVRFLSSLLSFCIEAISGSQKKSERKRERNSVFYPTVCFTVEKLQEFFTANVVLNQYRSDLASYSKSLCITWECTRCPTPLWPFLHCTSAFPSVSYTAFPSQFSQMVRPNECSISPVRPSYVKNTE